ncbi:hypothetical protein [Kitasatospora sp. NPDC058190]|uniref:hypothetical protein n=1 Tax=Kitasatospora sp. NPDC058190 TaxID=3346371 RepID=UPI0036D794FD
MVEAQPPATEHAVEVGELTRRWGSPRGWGWLPVAAALAVVALVAVRMPTGVMGTFGRILPAEHELARHVAPGLPWLPDLLARGGDGGGRR